MEHLAHGGLWALLGMTARRHSDGQPEVVLEADAQHFQALGRVHGGVIATLVDSATATAIHDRLPPGFRAATVDLHVVFLKPVDRPQQLVARGRVLSQGKAVMTAEAVVRDALGDPVAQGTAVYRVYPPRS